MDSNYFRIFGEFRTIKLNYFKSSQNWIFLLESWIKEDIKGSYSTDIHWTAAFAELAGECKGLVELQRIITPEVEAVANKIQQPTQPLKNRTTHDSINLISPHFEFIPIN